MSTEQVGGRVARFLCWVFGHQWKPGRELGKEHWKTGRPTGRVLIAMDCRRCGAADTKWVHRVPAYLVTSLPTDPEQEPSHD